MNRFFAAELLPRRQVDASKVDPRLKSGHERVGNAARTTRPDDVLEVGLEEHGPPAEPKPIGQLERGLIPLHSDGRIRLLRAPLGGCRSALKRP